MPYAWELYVFSFFLSFFLSFNLFLSSLESFCCMAFLSSGRWEKEEEQRSFVIAHISFNFLAAALFGIEAKEKTFCICLYRSVLLLYCRPLTWFDLSFLDQQATTTLSPLFLFFLFPFPDIAWSNLDWDFYKPHFFFFFLDKIYKPLMYDIDNLKH